MGKLRIVNIQRMSLHDGPGMRTTVFLKGCNLRCAWCHNPETQRAQPEILWDQNRCLGCGECVNLCAARRDRMGAPDRSKCVSCGRCEAACPGGAIQLAGREIETGELVRKLLRDRRMYEISSGGVTFSGGEPMLQFSQVAEAARQLKGEGIHIAVDTAGNVPWESFAHVMPHVDLFLYDLKTMDCDKHARFVGAPNQRILENLERLSKMARVVVRIPVIEEINAGEAEEMARFLSERCRVEKVDLMRYHTVGREKYRRMDREFVQFTPPDDERMCEIERAFGRWGVCAAE